MVEIVLVCGKCELLFFYVKLFIFFDNIVDNKYLEYLLWYLNYFERNFNIFRDSFYY